MAIGSVKAVEIEDNAELRRLAEEVRATGEPRMLRVAGRDIALIVPVASAEKTLSEEDIAAFESAAGGWKGIVDGEALKRQILEGRGEDLSSASTAQR